MLLAYAKIPDKGGRDSSVKHSSLLRYKANDVPKMFYYPSYRLTQVYWRKKEIHF